MDEQECDRNDQRQHPSADDRHLEGSGRLLLNSSPRRIKMGRVTIFPVRFQLECVPCVLNQVLRAVEWAGVDAPPAVVKGVLDEVMQFLSREDLLRLPAPVVGQFVYAAVNEGLGTRDAFAGVKRRQNEEATRLLPSVERFVDSSPDRLRAALVASIAGNSVDSGVPKRLDVEGAVKALGRETLAVDHLDELRSNLGDARSLLLVADNAGEIVFDKLLVEVLVEEFGPHRGRLREVAVAVRSGPIINDATMEDARSVSLTSTCRVVESSQSPGVILEQCGPEFRKLYQEADVVLAKGQGNYEALSEPDERGGRPTYFLLKAKCKVMERVLGVPLDSLVLLKRPPA
ncbi:MAG: DUF89 domain-containing protein [Promethearchaeota archaeon]